MREALLTTVLLVPVWGLNGQDLSKPPAFEVASVKPNRSGAVTGRAPTREEDRVTATNTPLRLLIQVAYSVGTDRLIVVGRQVAFVEYQVQHVVNRIQPCGQLSGRREFQRNLPLHQHLSGAINSLANRFRFQQHSAGNFLLAESAK